MQYMPQRTIKSIEIKAVKLQILKRPDPNTWTTEQLEILAQNPDMPPRELQERFFPERSYGSITSARFRIKHPTSPKPAGPESKSDAQPWTDRELEILKTHYGKMPTEELRTKYLPNRTYRCIAQTARNQTEIDTARTRWTAPEIQILIDHYGKMPTKEIQAKLLPNRSRSAIENKITSLRLSRKHKKERSDTHE